MKRTIIWNQELTDRKTLVSLIECRITHYSRLRTGHFVVWSEYPAEVFQPNEEPEHYAWILTEIPNDVREFFEEVRGELPFVVRLDLAT